MKISALFMSIIMAILSVFGISFKQNEYGVIDTVYSDAVCKGGNEKTEELKRLFSGVMQKEVAFEYCDSKNPFADDGRIKAIYYNGEEYNGKPCKVFAYIGFPENASESSPVPAMVLVHGGMGHACAEWVRYWLDNGYAAISIDGFGQHPKGGEYTGDESSDGWSHNPDSHMDIDEFSTAGKPFNEQWFYYYICDIIAANNIMRADKRIKTDCIGLTGISWGGFASSVAVCYDSRFKFAVPVYGCGFLGEGSGLFSEFVKKDDVLNVWEPSLLLDTVKIPVMWLCGDNDPFFSADAVTKSAYCTENGSVTFIPDYPHGQNKGAIPPEIVRFANEQNNIGNGNIKIDEVSFGGGRAVISLDIPDDVKNVKVSAYYRTSPLEYDNFNLKEEWKQVKAVTLGDIASVEIPENFKMIYFEALGKTGSLFSKTELHASTGVYTAEAIDALNADAKRLDSQKLYDNITKSITADLKSGKVGSAEILVNQFGERVFDGVYGLKNAEGDKLKKNALYRIASMTKPVTALALLIEHDRGHLSIYDDVSKYLPQYANMKVGKLVDGKVVITGEAKNNIQLYQLVSHMSGIASGDLGTYLTNQIPVNELSIDRVTEYFAAQPLEFDPGTSQSYSTQAFDVAAKIIEMTSGMPFDEYIKVNIFDKLGMKDTTYRPNEEQWNRMVDIHGYTEENGAYFTKGVPGCVFGNYPVSYLATGAGLASTAEDYMKFAQMLLNEGKAPDGTQIISPETLRLMSTPHISAKLMGGFQRWGVGVRVVVEKAVLPIGAYGWSGAYGSHFWIDPVNNITAVYMKNSSYDGGAGNRTANQFEEDVMASFK